MSRRNERSPAGEVALKYCRTNPELPTNTLARLMFEENKKLFRDFAQASKMVRYYRGESGTKNRSNAKETATTTKDQSEIQIPKGLRQGYSPIIVPPCKALLLSDLHVPWHDEKAIELAVGFGLEQGCNTLYLNGDVCDFYSISPFDADPRNRDLLKEVETVKIILHEFSQKFDNLYFKSGNHEDWWSKHLYRRAPDIVELGVFDLEKVLCLEEMGYTYVKSKQWSQMASLTVLHGHEIKGYSPVNPARGIFLRLNQTAVVGHYHRSSHHSDNQAISKKSISCWSVGCLFDLSPEYDPLNKWNLGFAIIEHDGEEFDLSNFKIDYQTHKIWGL